MVRAGERATQEADDRRRGKGYVVGAFIPATNAAFTMLCPRRTTAHWVVFLEQVDAWLGKQGTPISAILDNLSGHRPFDELLWEVAAHPRWEFVFQATYASYLNLIEPW